MTGIYEKLLCKWLLSLHWLMHWPSESQDHSGSWLVCSNWFLTYSVKNCYTEIQSPSPPCDQAHRPLEAKLLLNEKLISEFLYFPQAPKGTTTAVLLSSVPYCMAYGFGRKEKKTLAIGVCTKRNPSSRRSKWFNTQLITQLFHSCLWFFHCVSMPT